MSDRQRRPAASIKTRTASPSTIKCSQLGCSRPANALAGKGRARWLCKVHLKHRARHGHEAWKSFTGAERREAEAAARVWLKGNRTRFVLSVIAQLESMLRQAGPAESAYDLNRMPARDRARVALARLREAAVSGETILTKVIGIWALCRNK